jgi:hypothetical protein
MDSDLDAYHLHGRLSIWVISVHRSPQDNSFVPKGISKPAKLYLSLEGYRRPQSIVARDRPGPATTAFEVPRVTIRGTGKHDLKLITDLQLLNKTPRSFRCYGSCDNVLLNEQAIYQEQRGWKEAVEVPLRLQVQPILNYGIIISECQRGRGANLLLFKDVRHLLRDRRFPTRWHLVHQFIADLLS